MRDKLVFSRIQLQAVFKDFNTVKEFERLVDQVNMGVVDMAQNANGEYVKFGNSLLVQWGNISIPGVVWSVISLPSVFIDTNYTAVVTLAAGSVKTVITYNDIPAFKDTTKFKCYVEGVLGTNYSVAWLAIGRWK